MNKNKIPAEIVKGARVPQGIKALAVLAMSLAACRRLISQHSVMFFAWYYLGITLALHQEIWAHKLLRTLRGLILAPRGHGKSELVCRIIPLWLIVRNRDVRILIVAASGGSKGLATKHVMLLKAELTDNKRLIRDYGAFYHPKLSGMWQQEIFKVVREKKMKDATVEAVSIFGSITGGRFDFIIIDDPIDLKTTNSATVMARMQAEITGTILPLLAPRGCAWMLGTRKHYADIFGWAIKSPRWKTIIYKAITREPSGYKIVKRDEPILRTNANGDIIEERHKIIFHVGDQGECLWPEHKSMEDLLLERFELGTITFNREYQNEIIDDATAQFRLSWLQQCRDESLSYIAGHMSDEERDRYRIVVQGVDPSLVTDKKHAQATDSDYMVQVAIGLTDDGDRVLLALDRDRGLSPKAVEDRIKAFYKRIRPYRCAIEKNAFGLIHAQNLIEDTDMRIIKHNTGNNKNDPYEGVPHLSPLFENAKFKLPYKTDEDKTLTDSLIAEFHAFGSDIHDDQVMAVWITCYLILRYLRGQARKRRNEQRET